MEKHETKCCPRCGQSFICKAGDIARCQCTEVILQQQTIDFLAKTRFDCLCANCLNQINRNLLLTQHYAFPVAKQMFVEGIHYYKEEGYLVFTELYHTLRGKCCENGCRHCPYGFERRNEY